ncbi:MAG TPA: Crp/Fnr family transcriptional regulator [Solirubrobacteraceae bacterium]|jgi:CRP-like cAMP-binding protein|nr:Crp/Fnr family transcriptional regulator [Solirubrobacteraceae bacterium]
MVPTPTIRLFDAEPDLIRFLGPEDSERARETQLPVHSLNKGDTDIQALFESSSAFGALVLEGMLLQSLRLGNHSGLRLLGPGDILSITQTPKSILVIESTCRATVPTRLALLEREMLMAVRRWPQIAAGLHAHTGEQSERLVTQLMICQLPRVDERIVALMWLLAESWGQVTPAGTFLPISLTHAALGGLIGARRPTVTLALGNLTHAGLLRRQQRGWLLLGSPDQLAAAGSAHHRSFAPSE